MKDYTKTVQKTEIVFTELEQKFIDAYIPMLYAEEGFSDVDANDVSEKCGIPMKTIRGVLGSLVKKGVVTIYETESAGFGEKEYELIYLSPEFFLSSPNLET